MKLLFILFSRAVEALTLLIELMHALISLSPVNSLLTHITDLSSSCYSEHWIAVVNQLLYKLLLYSSFAAVIGLISACG